MDTKVPIGLSALGEKLRHHETTVFDDTGKCYEVSVNEVTGVDIAKAPCIRLEVLTEDTRRRLGTAASADEGHYEVVVVEEERALIVFNRWYGAKGKGNSSIDEDNDDEELTEHMFSAFRRPFDDQQDRERRAPPDELVETPHFGGITLDGDARQGIVCASTFSWLASLGASAGIVQLEFAGSESVRSGIVALQVEFKRERNGVREPVSMSQFAKCVERARANAEREAELWKRREPKLTRDNYATL